MTTNKEKTYNVVCVSDANYMQHTAVMLCSLFEINPTKTFHVFLITDNPSYAHLVEDAGRKLKELCFQHGATLSFCPCPLENIKDLPVGQWSTFMYLKLFIPTVLPDRVTRCLFLDVDLVINDDIAALYDTELGESVLAACEDLPECMAFKPRLGLKPEDVYVNSGVMVCDVEKWRAMQARENIFDFTRSIAANIRNEQDVIATYFRGRIKLLPIKWNMVTFYFMQQPKIFDKYLPQLPEARRHPAIVHFAAPIKPWYSDCQHPYRHLYRKYLRKTPWRGAKFERYEQLTPRQRFNKLVKLFLSSVGLRKDPLYLVKK